jgi:hypothetical protein
MRRAQPGQTTVILAPVDPDADPDNIKMPRPWGTWALVTAICIVLATLLLFATYRVTTGILERPSHLTMRPETPAATATGSPTDDPSPSDDVTTEPTDDPTTDAPTTDPATEPTTAPTTKPARQPALVTHWAVILVKRACAQHNGTFVSSTPATITCAKTTTVEQPVSQADMSRQGCPSPDNPVGFGDHKTWYCQTGPNPTDIIPVNWEAVCGPNAYREIDTKHPACIVNQTHQFTLQVGSQLDDYCKGRGYQTSASGHAPERRDQPYCKKITRES